MSVSLLWLISDVLNLFLITTIFCWLVHVCVGSKRSSGKSGCFSPKTSKGGVRRSFRGFLRRLSGGRSCQVMFAAETYASYSYKIYYTYSRFFTESVRHQKGYNCIFASIRCLHSVSAVCCWNIWCRCGVWMRNSHKPRRLRHISTCIVSTVRASEKSSLISLSRIGNRPWAFQRAIDEVHLLLLIPQTCVLEVNL